MPAARRMVACRSIDRHRLLDHAHGPVLRSLAIGDSGLHAASEKQDRLRAGEVAVHAVVLGLGHRLRLPDRVVLLE